VGKSRVVVVLVLVAMASAARRAEAIPAFARATGMGCPACHESWPLLSPVGELYRDRGYRVHGTEDTSSRPLDYIPIAFRTTLAYQFTSTTHQATDAGDRTVTTGSFPHPEADLLFGMSLSPKASMFAVATGFGEDGTVSLESAWGRLNDLGDTSWLNLKVGKHELDLPRSEHRSYTLTAPFLIYHYHPLGSSNGFSIGDNQLGLELSGHAEDPGLRYAVSLVTATGNPGSDSVLSSPAIYARATYSYLPDSTTLSRVRFGVFGDVGWVPTKFDTLTPQDGMAAPVPGTGTDHARFLQVGGELHLAFGRQAAPLVLSIVYLYGTEDLALVEGGTRAASYHGGFAELDYVPTLDWTIFGRADAVWNLQQADPTAPSDSNDQQAFTVGVRYGVWTSPWGSMAVHVELGTLNTENAAATPTNPVRITTLLAGLDLAI